MTKDDELMALVGSYMTANPDAVNPMENIFVFGESGLIELLTIAENRLIEFKIEPGVMDGIFPYIDGKLVKLS